MLYRSTQLERMLRTVLFTRYKVSGNVELSNQPKIPGLWLWKPCVLKHGAKIDSNDSDLGCLFARGNKSVGETKSAVLLAVILNLPTKF